MIEIIYLGIGLIIGVLLGVGGIVIFRQKKENIDFLHIWRFGDFPIFASWHSVPLRLMTATEEFSTNVRPEIARKSMPNLLPRVTECS